MFLLPVTKGSIHMLRVLEVHFKLLFFVCVLLSHFKKKKKLASLYRQKRWHFYGCDTDNNDFISNLLNDNVKSNLYLSNSIQNV